MSRRTRQAFLLAAACIVSGAIGSTGSASAAVFVGTDRADFIEGTRLDDQIEARGGNDEVYGRGGNDTIRGGAGEDVLWGHCGNDVLYGDGSHDGLADNTPGCNDTDLLFGGDGPDTLDAQDGDSNDFLFAGAGYDFCYVDKSEFGQFGNFLLTFVSSCEQIIRP